MSSSKPQKLHVDPEEDLDELDDVLSQFNPAVASPSASSHTPASPLTSPPPPPPSAAMTGSFGRPRTNTRVDAPPHSVPGSGRNLDSTTEADEDDFARELAEGMENLMREIAGEAGLPPRDAASDDSTQDERARALKAAWEAMLVEGMDGNLGEDGLEGLAGDKGAAGGFQEKIKQAMNKMKENESKLQGSSGTPGAAPSPESLEALLQSLGDLGLGEGEDETELAGFLEKMMGQLMSKDVLYEPLKELADGFPGYLANPPAPLSDEDKTRYENQLSCVKKILAVFDKSTYTDTNADDNKQIVDLMSEMQSYGTPPTEIMGTLPPGFDTAGGLGDPENCTIA